MTTATSVRDAERAKGFSIGAWPAAALPQRYHRARTTDGGRADEMIREKKGQERKRKRVMKEFEEIKAEGEAADGGFVRDPPCVHSLRVAKKLCYRVRCGGLQAPMRKLVSDWSKDVDVDDDPLDAFGRRVHAPVMYKWAQH